MAFDCHSHSQQVDLSNGLLECPHNMAVASLRVSDPKESQMEDSAFYDLVLEVLYLYFTLILFVGSKSLNTVHTQRRTIGLHVLKEMSKILDIFKNHLNMAHFPLAVDHEQVSTFPCEF